MEIRPHRIIKRRKTKKIKLGNVSVGGDSEISVQSMTNTLTTEVKKTIEQILSLEKALMFMVILKIMLRSIIFFLETQDLA